MSPATDGAGVADWVNTWGQGTRPAILRGVVGLIRLHYEAGPTNLGHACPGGRAGEILEFLGLSPTVPLRGAPGGLPLGRLMGQRCDIVVANQRETFGGRVF